MTTNETVRVPSFLCQPASSPFLREEMEVFIAARTVIPIHGQQFSYEFIAPFGIQVNLDGHAVR